MNPRTGQTTPRSAKCPSDLGSGRLAAREPTAVAPVAADPVEEDDQPTTVTAEVRHAEAAVRATQNGAGQWDVGHPIELGGEFVLLVDDALAVGQAQVTLELYGALAHLVGVDPTPVAVLEIRHGA